MAKKKKNPLVLMLPGLLLIVAAVVGHFGGLFSSEKEAEDDVDAVDAVLATTSAPASKMLKQGAEKPAKKKISIEEPAPAKSPREDRAEMTKILLAQIRKSPDTMDLGWLASFSQFIDDESSFRRYFDDVLNAGAKRYNKYASRQKRANKEPTSNPHFFLEEAKRTLYSKTASADKVAKHGLDWLAAAYY